MDWSIPGFPVFYNLPGFAQVHVHWVCDVIQPSLILCHPLLLLPSVFPSIRVFFSELALCIRWPKYWSFNVLPVNIQRFLVWSPCNIRDSQESSPAPQFEASILLSALTSIYNYWKNHSLTVWTFVGKVMSLLFNTLSSLVIAFLPRSKCLLSS